MRKEGSILQKQNNPYLETKYLVGFSSAITAYAFFTVGASLYYKGNCQSNYQFVLNLCMQPFSTLLTKHLERHYEERNGTIKSKVELRDHLINRASAASVSKQTDDGVIPRDYTLACDLYHQARLLHEEIHASNITRESIIYLLDILHDEAYVNYRLNRFDVADSLITIALKYLHDNQFSCDKTKTKLFNLRGLIAFIKSYIKLDSQKLKFKEMAKESFEQSYAIDSSQDNVGVYLRFLSDNDSELDDDLFFSDAAPLDREYGVATLNLNTLCSLSDYIHFVYAEGCAREKSWEKALRLYKLQEPDLVTPKIDKAAFFSGFIVHLQYLKAYQAVVDSNFFAYELCLLPIYDLCLMLNSDAPLEKGKIYISHENGTLNYSVVIPDGDVIKNIKTNIPSPKDFTLEALQTLRNAILEVTSKAGHTMLSGDQAELEQNKLYLASDPKSKRLLYSMRLLNGDEIRNQPLVGYTCTGGNPTEETLKTFKSEDIISIVRNINGHIDPALVKKQALTYLEHQKKRNNITVDEYNAYRQLLDKATSNSLNMNVMMPQAATAEAIAGELITAETDVLLLANSEKNKEGKPYQADSKRSGFFQPVPIGPTIACAVAATSVVILAGLFVAVRRAPVAKEHVIVTRKSRWNPVNWFY